MAIEINRKKYQEIRKMDHTQMSKFFNKVYQEGYEAGKSEYITERNRCNTVTSEDIKKILTTVKGIGDKKAEDIINILAEPLNIE